MKLPGYPSPDTLDSPCPQFMHHARRIPRDSTPAGNPHSTRVGGKPQPTVCSSHSSTPSRRRGISVLQGLASNRKPRGPAVAPQASFEQGLAAIGSHRLTQPDLETPAYVPGKDSLSGGAFFPCHSHSHTPITTPACKCVHEWQGTRAWGGGGGRMARKRCCRLAYPGCKLDTAPTPPEASSTGCPNGNPLRRSSAVFLLWLTATRGLHTTPSS